MTSPRSRRVGLIAGYYRLTAVLSGFGLAATLAVAPTHWSSFLATLLAHPLAFASWSVGIATSWWTGELIGQRQRFGAWIAVTSIGLGVLTRPQMSWGSRQHSSECDLQASQEFFHPRPAGISSCFRALCGAAKVYGEPVPNPEF